MIFQENIICQKKKIDTPLMWLKQDMVDPECYHVDRPAAPKAVISTKTGQIWYLTKVYALPSGMHITFTLCDIEKRE